MRTSAVSVPSRPATVSVITTAATTEKTPAPAAPSPRLTSTTSAKPRIELATEPARLMPPERATPRSCSLCRSAVSSVALWVVVIAGPPRRR